MCGESSLSSAFLCPPQLVVHDSPVRYSFSLRAALRARVEKDESYSYGVATSRANAISKGLPLGHWETWTFLPPGAVLHRPPNAQGLKPGFMWVPYGTTEVMP